MKKIFKILLLSFTVAAVIILSACASTTDIYNPTEAPTHTPSPTPERMPAVTPHPDSTVNITLSEKGSSDVIESYTTFVGETLCITYDSEKHIGHVNYKISPSGGAAKTVSKDASLTPGAFKNYIEITSAMSGRSYTVSAAGYDINGQTVTEFESFVLNIEKNIYNLKLKVGNKEYKIRAYDDSYESDTFICLTDLADALSGTAKKCTIERPAGSINDLSSRWIIVNGKQVRYYNYLHSGAVFSKIIDACMMTDIYMTEENGTLIADTLKSFSADLDTLSSAGYFRYLNGAVLGNLETGEIIFSEKADDVIAIASTTKLMTWIVVRDAQKNGVISKNDTVAISAEAAAVSESEDGVFSLSEGKTIPCEELEAAMLLSSSNEAAVALACHVSGSEKAFVELMNDKAKQIGLETAVFYNCSGLPCFTGKVFSPKVENCMSARDMFKLLQYIVKYYPEITNYTSAQYYKMTAIGSTATNSNPLVFNINGTIGFKTGCTNNAGYCLISAVEIKADGKKQHIAALVYGAQDTAERDRLSELLIRSGINR